MKEECDISWFYDLGILVIFFLVSLRSNEQIVILGVWCGLKLGLRKVCSLYKENSFLTREFLSFLYSHNGVCILTVQSK